MLWQQAQEKTLTAFQIIHRLYQSKKVKKVLYLADRNILIDQTILNDFAPFAKKTIKEVTIRSSAAEHLTFVAATGENPQSVEMRYEDENI